MTAAATLVLLRAVLARYGLFPERISDIRTGRVNRHWRIAASGGDYVLRRYNRGRPVAAIRYEHRVLTHAAAKGWPVATPLHAGRDMTVVDHEGGRYALFPFLQGRPAAYGSRRRLRDKGRHLARLHGDLDECKALGQREGFGRLTDLDALVPAAAGSSFDALLRRFGREHPNEAKVVARLQRQMLHECARLSYGDLPDAVVHSDFFHDNLLFQRGQLTAVLDFDLVHLDARVADVATSLAFDCLERPDYNAVDPSAATAFVSGYVEASPLAGSEVELIVPLLRAQIIGLVAWRLPQWAEGSNQALRSIRRSVHERLPRFEARRRALETAVREGAAGASG